MNSLDVSQCMRGLANLRLPCRSLVQALVARAFNMLDTFSTQVCVSLYLVVCSCIMVDVSSMPGLCLDLYFVYLFCKDAKACKV